MLSVAEAVVVTLCAAVLVIVARLLFRAGTALAVGATSLDQNLLKYFPPDHREPLYAIVTGASSGIGREIAILLATHSCANVIITALDSAGLEEVKSYIACAKPEARVIAHPCNLADVAQRSDFVTTVRAIVAGHNILNPAAVRPVTEAARRQSGQLQLVVNCAGTSTRWPKPLWQHTQQDIQQIHGVNCAAALELTHALLSELLPSINDVDSLLGQALEDQALPRPRRGLVIVSSSAGLLPAPLCSVYGATKAFCVSLVESMHAELSAWPRQYDLDVLAVTPGMVNCGNTPVWFGSDRMTRWDVATPGMVAKATLKSLGRVSTTCGYVVHDIYAELFTLLPRSLLQKLVWSNNFAAHKAAATRTAWVRK